MSVPLGRLSRRPASSPGANPQLSSEKGRVSEMDGVEQQLRKLGGNLTGTLNRLRLPATLVDREGVIRWQNPAARRTYGDRAGLKVGSVVLRDAGNDVDARLGEILWNGEAADFSLRAKLPDGRTERIEVCAVPVFGGGAAVGVFGVSQSVVRGVPVRRTSNHTELTGRQLDVLALLADGRSTREIAQTLGISITTVRNHVASLMRTLGAHTRLEAVMMASRAGLV
jgi:DNA-binding CsgD family transcriptional regulator